MAATSVVDRLDGRDFDRSSLAWPLLAAGLGFAVLGILAKLPVLAGLGLLLAGGVVVVVAPELLYALFLSAGIIKANPVFASVPGDLTIATAGAISLAMLVRVLRGGVPPLPAATAIFPALAALGLLSVFWSDLPGTGLSKALLFETMTLLAFFSPFILIRTRSQLTRFMVAIVGIALFVALTAEKTGHPSKPLVAAGGNEIELALICGFGLLAAFGYLLVIGKSGWGVLWMIPAAYLAYTILQAGSRGVLVGAGLALLFLIVRLALARARARGLLLAIVAAAVIAVVAAGPQLFGEATGKYQSELFSITSNPATVLRQRDWYFSQGMELAVAHPLGTGSAGYQAATGEKYPHNLVLEYASEQGIPGLVLFLALFVAAWRALLRPALRGTPEAAVCGALLILFAVESLVSFGPNEARPLWFALGLALALPNLRTDR
jgi:O-antigen ligase